MVGTAILKIWITFEQTNISNVSSLYNFRYRWDQQRMGVLISAEVTKYKIYTLNHCLFKGQNNSEPRQQR